MRNRHEPMILLLVFLLLIVGARLYVVSRVDWKAQAQIEVAAIHHAEAMGLKKKADDANAKAGVLESKAVELSGEINRLRAKLDGAKRPDPVPTPPEDGELNAHLAQYLIEPPKLRVDAVKVWNWQSEAGRVLGFEIRLNVCEALTKSQDQRESVRVLEVAELEKARDGYLGAYNAEKSRAEALLVVSSTPRYSAGIGSSVDPRTGAKRVAFVVQKHLDRDWSIGAGSINGGAFVIAVKTWR